MLGRHYRKDLHIPEGVHSVMSDPESLELATSSCPTTREEVYVGGSAPTQFCEIHGGGHGIISSAGSVLSHIFGGGQPSPPADPAKPGGTVAPGQNQTVIGPDGKELPAADGDQKDKKKNPLKKIFGIFGGKKKDSDKPQKPPEKGESP